MSIIARNRSFARKDSNGDFWPNDALAERAAAAAVLAGPAAAARPGPAGLTGTNGDDTLVGTSGDDVIDGLDGDDRLEGLGGNDTLDGGAGFDVLIGGTGNDLYYLTVNPDEIRELAGEGTDTIRVEFSYTLPAAVSIEIIYANNAALTPAVHLVGNELGNTIQGTFEDDILDGGGGSDLLYGLKGDDTYYSDGGDLTRELVGEGFDTVIASGQFILASGQEVEVIRSADQNSTATIVLRGNDFANQIFGNNGGGQIDGGSGADLLVGFGGNDVYFVDNAGDQVVEAPGGGTDEVHTSVNYTLVANVENVRATGNSSLALTGNADANVLTGNGANDVLDGKEGNDTLTAAGGGGGFDGNDIFAFSTAPGAGNVDTIVNFRIADDKIRLVGGSGGAYAAIAAGPLVAEAFVIGTQATTAAHRIIYNQATGALYYDYDGVGGAAAVQFAAMDPGLSLASTHFIGTGDLVNETNDTVTGTNGVDDMLAGYGGNDTLDGLTGNDTTDGGTGNDSHYVDSAGDVVIERVAEGSDRVYASVSYVLPAAAYVEILSTDNDAGTAAINLTGNDTPNTLIGNAGDNVLSGAGGDDLIIGGAGANSINGGSGTDTADYSAAPGAVMIDLLGGPSANGYGGNDTLTGIEILIGSAAGDVLAGDGLANVLRGGLGSDVLIGRGGDDSYYVGQPGDVVYEGASGGADRVYASVDYTLLAGQEVEILSTDNANGTAALALGGNDFANTIYGNAGNNILYGKGGVDHLEGAFGHDIYYVEDAGDVVIERIGEGSDRVFASVSYTLTAGSYVEILSTTSNAGTGAIDLTGNERYNSIYGNDGDNVIAGKAGGDSLIGGGGADTFVFDTALGASNVDLLYDFVSGTDTLSLDQAIFGALSSGSLPGSAFVTGTAAVDADDRIIYNSATGALLYDADGNGAGAAIQFATLISAPALTASDFIIF